MRERRDVRNVKCVWGSAVKHQIGVVGHRNRVRMLTVYFLRHNHGHFDQPQLIHLRFKVPYEPFERIHPVRFRQRIIEKFENLQRQLVP
jgi:hypothetical protein